MALICVARTAVERREARAPEALADGNIRLCGALPCPLARYKTCALRRSASLFIGRPVRGNSLAKLGRTGAPRERVAIFTSPRRGEVERSEATEGEEVRMPKFFSDVRTPHPNPLPWGERERKRVARTNSRRLSRRREAARSDQDGARGATCLVIADVA